MLVCYFDSKKQEKSKIESATNTKSIFSKLIILRQSQPKILGFSSIFFSLPSQTMLRTILVKFSTLFGLGKGRVYWKIIQRLEYAKMTIFPIIFGRDCSYRIGTLKRNYMPG